MGVRTVDRGRRGFTCQKKLSIFMSFLSPSRHAIEQKNNP